MTRTAEHIPGRRDGNNVAAIGHRHPIQGFANVTSVRMVAGPVFRSVALGGRIGTAALSPYAASLVIKQRIAAIFWIPPPTAATACARAS